MVESDLEVLLSERAAREIYVKWIDTLKVHVEHGISLRRNSKRRWGWVDFFSHPIKQQKGILDLKGGWW